MAALPEGMRSRLAGADGKPDPEKLAQFRTRACPADGSAAPRFDPDQFARLRTVLCAEATPDLSALPERVAQRPRGAGGQAAPPRLAQQHRRAPDREGGWKDGEA